MAEVVRFDVFGVEEVIDAIRNFIFSYVARLDQNIHIALENDVLPRIRTLTPVRTGRTRAGWRVLHLSTFRYAFANRTPYAAFIPQGNRRFGPIIEAEIRRQFPRAVQLAVSRTRLLN